MEDELQRMKNLGKTSVQWLHASGIHSANDLRRLGAIQAFLTVKARGFRISRTLLYAIEGALLDRHWCDLSTEQKAALDLQLNNRTRKALAPCESGYEK